MIKVGNILINPDDISSIHRDQQKAPSDNRMRGYELIQIIYKSGVVKNITSFELGMSYTEFVDALLTEAKKRDDNRILRTLTAIKSMTNG